MKRFGVRDVARVFGCLVLGVVVGVVGTVAHRVQILDARLPVGIVLVLLAVFAAGVLSRAWVGLGGLLGFGGGWLVVVQLLSVQGPGGDLLVPNQAVGLAWVYGGLLMVAVCAFVPRSWFSDRPVGRRSDGPTPVAASAAGSPGVSAPEALQGDMQGNTGPTA